MKTLSIVIPVYNEEERLDRTFEALTKLQLPHGLKLEKVVFVNDGSTDKTKEIIKRFTNSSTVGGVASQHPRGVLISYRSNKGKGHAISRGMKESQSDYTLFCDVDISTPFSELKKFIPYMKKDAPVIIGTRKNGGSTVIRHQPFVREILGRGFTLLSNIFLNLWVSDFTCGFKAFSKEAKDVLFSVQRINRWGFDPEVLFLGRISGFTIEEVPVEWSDDRRSKVNVFRDLPMSFLELFMIRIYYYLGWYQKVRVNVRPQLAYSIIETIKTILF